MNLVGWVAAYIVDGEEQVFTSRESSWENLPDDGFAAGKVFYDSLASTGQRYGTVMSGFDWYLVDVPGNMFPHNNDTIEDNLQRYPYPRSMWKRGKWAPTDLYEQVRLRVFRLQDVP